MFAQSTHISYHTEVFVKREVGCTVKKKKASTISKISFDNYKKKVHYFSSQVNSSIRSYSKIPLMKIFLQISKSMKTQTGQCTILKYAVVRRPGQICISKKAVTLCAAGCQPSQPELLEKQIPFTCLKEDRVTERYVNKAERGERLPEIEARPTAYESKVPQPRTCIPSSNEL